MPPLDWTTEGRHWPLAEHSRFVEAGGLRWHVQQLGDHAPVMLLVHGIGASSHSWRALGPMLAQRFTVIAPDLPGHGFTQRPRSGRLCIDGVAAALDDLLHALRVRPAVVVGHGAGAAILARLCLDRPRRPHVLISMNGAFLPESGIAAQHIPPAARFLLANPLAPSLLARRLSDVERIRRLVRGMGSRIDQSGLELYARLLGHPGHLGATLAMIAKWNVEPLLADLPRLSMPLVLVSGEEDRAVPPVHVKQVSDRVPGSRVFRLPGLGHLAHEEDARTVHALLRDVCAAVTVQAGAA